MTGAAIEGADAEDYMMEVGGGELLPDFEENLVGMNAGERKQFGVTFPADYDEESLRDSRSCSTSMSRRSKSAICRN